MKTKRILIALSLILVLALWFVAFAACSGGDDPDPSFPKYKITVQSTDECALSVDKTEAEFAEVVTVTVNLKTTDKYIDKVTYNGEVASKRTDTTYEFLMGSRDVTVAVELKAYEQRLSDGNGFATFLTYNPETIAKNCGTIGLTVSLNGSYMTILNWNIRSTNQAAIPGSSKNSYDGLTETGALSAHVQTASQSNVITALTINVDTDKIASGSTFLLIDLQNGNSSSQKASLVVPITVADEIVTTKWSEKLVFDVSALSSKIQQGKFNVYVTDFDFVTGSDNQEYQKFEQLQVNADGNVEVEIEYVPSHRYYVAFWVVADDGSTVNYKLLDTVGHGSSETGYNMLQKGMLTLLADGQTFTLTVTNEIG